MYDNKFMIICFNNKINNLTKKNLNINYIQNLMPTLDDVKDHKCPYCKGKNTLIKYGHYNRNISILQDNKIQNFYVAIQRAQCKSCKRTHALLPHFVVPYVIMAVISISKIVSNSAKTSVYKLSNLIELAHQTIYRYIAMVLAFFADYKILNNKKEYIKINKFNKKYFLTNCEKLSNQNHRLDFFEFYNWALFMQKFRNNSSPPVGVFVSKRPPT